MSDPTIEEDILLSFSDTGLEGQVLWTKSNHAKSMGRPFYVAGGSFAVVSLGHVEAQPRIKVVRLRPLTGTHLTDPERTDVLGEFDYALRERLFPRTT